jgi:hypothetical protein
MQRGGLPQRPSARAANSDRVTDKRKRVKFTANIRNRNTRMAYAVAVRELGSARVTGARRFAPLF